MNVAAIYTRVSTSAQEEDGLSLEGQLEACLAEARELGFVVPDHLRFTDTHTGFEYGERRGLQTMLEALRQGEFKAIIAWEQDRVSRKGTHTSMVAYELEQANADLYFVGGRKLDLSAQGEFLRGVNAFMAEMEREKIKARTMLGKERLVKNGTPLRASHPPYGYAWREDERGKAVALVVNETQANVLRWIMGQVLNEGRSLTKIAKDLNERGEATPNGGVWMSSNLSKLLRKGVYVGKYEAFSRSKTRDIVIIEVPAIFTEDEQHALVAAIDRNQKFSPRRIANETLLRGFVFCSCGAGMGMTTKPHTRDGVTRRYGVYQCNNAERHQVNGMQRGRMAVTKLDNAVWETIANTLLDREQLAAARELGAQEDPTAFERERLEDLIATRQRRLKNAYAQLLDEDDTTLRGMLAETVKGLTKEVDELEGERAKLVERHEAWQQEQANLMALDEYMGHVAEALAADDVPLEKKRAIMHALQVRVVVKQGERFQQADLSWIVDSEPLPLPISYKSNPVRIGFASSTCWNDTRKRRLVHLAAVIAENLLADDTR